MTSTRDLGKQSEQIACEYLEKINFSIIEKNWRSGKYGEIDLVTIDNKTGELVFVEVKSRTTTLEEAKELVTKNKQEQLYNLAKSYIYLHKKENKACRFDIIAIRMNKDKSKLEHIKNAF